MRAHALLTVRTAAGQRVTTVGAGHLLDTRAARHDADCQRISRGRRLACRAVLAAAAEMRLTLGDAEPVTATLVIAGGEDVQLYEPLAETTRGLAGVASVVAYAAWRVAQDECAARVAIGRPAASLVAVRDEAHALLGAARAAQ